ncbi:hypothetical protein ACHAQA_009644 [Verticillium albo-atrum]
MQTSTLFQTAAALAAVVITYVISQVHHAWAIRRKYPDCKPVPNLRTEWPLGLDIIRDALRAGREMRAPEFFRGLLNSMNGPLSFHLRVGTTTAIFTADETIIKAILANQFADFGIGDERHNNAEPFLGDGIFTVDGEAWRHSRALLKPAFARSQLSGGLDIEERHLQNLMTVLQPVRSRGAWTREVDLQTLFLRFSLDSSTEFLFGATVNSQLKHAEGSMDSPGAAGEIDFANAFDTAMKGFAIRSEYMDLGKWVWPAGFQQACKDCHAFVDDYVQQRRMSSAETDEEKYSFFDALAAETQDPLEMRSQLLNILLAGRDTTASLMGWMFYALARDPGRYKKLRDVIVEQFGTYDDSREITFEAIKMCKYLQYVMNETLRLWPIVPFNARRALRDTTLPSGGGPDGKSKVFVHKGATVTYAPFILHRRPDLWGDDAEEFIPERWEGRKSGWEYLPFNGGPRICLGQQFALTKAGYTTIKLLQRFDAIENMDNEPAIKYKMTATLSPGHGVRVRLHEAE